MTAVTTDIAVLERLVEVAGRDIVDVGCGSGWLARELAARGAHVTALEISDEQLATARASADGASVTYAIGRAEALPLPDASQDVVVLMRSLHHVPEPQMAAALAEARRVIRNDGVVYVSEPVPEGDLFSLVSLLEDEAGVRQAAQEAIADAGRAGLCRVTTERYEVGNVIADLDAFRARMVGVDPERGPTFDARRAELQRVFDRAGEPARDHPGAKLFRQVQRVDVLRAV